MDELTQEQRTRLFSEQIVNNNGTVKDVGYSKSKYFHAIYQKYRVHTVQHGATSKNLQQPKSPRDYESRIQGQVFR